MNMSYSDTEHAAMNGHVPDEQSTGDMVDVNVEETVGVVILGVLFFFLLLAFLRSTRRERQLLTKLAELQSAERK